MRIFKNLEKILKTWKKFQKSFGHPVINVVHCSAIRCALDNTINYKRIWSRNWLFKFINYNYQMKYWIKFIYRTFFLKYFLLTYSLKLSKKKLKLKDSQFLIVSAKISWICLKILQKMFCKYQKYWISKYVVAFIKGVPLNWNPD